MNEAEIRSLQPGEKVYTWTFTGRDGRGYDTQDIMEGTVVKVCAKTVLIDWNPGFRRYTAFDHIYGRVTW